jgi:hypothetical protein
MAAASPRLGSAAQAGDIRTEKMRFMGGSFGGFSGSLIVRVAPDSRSKIRDARMLRRSRFDRNHSSP